MIKISSTLANSRQSVDIQLRALALAELASSSDTDHDTAMEMAPRRLGVAFAALRWRHHVGASILFGIRGARGVERAALAVASSAPPSPSRHDPWRFLRCVDLRNRHRDRDAAQSKCWPSNTFDTRPGAKGERQSSGRLKAGTGWISDKTGSGLSAQVSPTRTRANVGQTSR